MYVLFVVNRFAELQQYSALPFSPAVDLAECDVVIEKPTILIKLDAGLSFSVSVCLFVCLCCTVEMDRMSDFNIWPKLKVWAGSPNFSVLL